MGERTYGKVKVCHRGFSFYCCSALSLHVYCLCLVTELHLARFLTIPATCFLMVSFLYDSDGVSDAFDRV